jgi:hypothetical protein
LHLDILRLGANSLTAFLVSVCLLSVMQSYVLISTLTIVSVLITTYLTFINTFSDVAKTIDRDINQRIKTICDAVFGGNVTQMAKTSFISRTTLISIMGEQQSAPGYDVLRKIVEIPTVDINEAWLLTGKGEMIKQTEPIQTQSNSGGNNQQGNNNNQFNLCPDDAAHIRELEKEIEHLRAQLAHKDDIIAEMRSSAAKQDERISELKDWIADLRKTK